MDKLTSNWRDSQEYDLRFNPTIQPEPTCAPHFEPKPTVPTSEPTHRVGGWLARREEGLLVAKDLTGLTGYIL